jgi:hypothetical protein
MFDEMINDSLKGYSHEQYSEALYQLLINYLNIKGIIDIKDMIEFQKENFPIILKGIVDRDKKESEKRYQEYKDSKLEKSDNQ